LFQQQWQQTVSFLLFTTLLVTSGIAFKD